MKENLGKNVVYFVVAVAGVIANHLSSLGLPILRCCGWRYLGKTQKSGLLVAL